MADKKTCFVIMPFEEPYKGRCEGIYERAIREAGLEPHVAGGDGSDIITEEIEQGIRDARVCFADISDNNPNVWYELGFAYACGKSVVMVCDKEKRRTKLPFDISVKKVIFYEGTKADSDDNHREGFQSKITKGLKTKAQKVATVSVGTDKAAASVVGKASTPVASSDLDVSKFTSFDMKVFGAIIEICADGKRGASERRVKPLIPNLTHLGERKVREAFSALKHFNLIEIRGRMSSDDAPTYKPTLQGKEWFFNNRGKKQP